MKRLLLAPLILALSPPAFAEVKMIDAEITKCQKEVRGHTASYSAGKELAIRLNRLFEIKPEVIKKKILSKKWSTPS